MEIKINAGDSIKVPHGVKAIIKEGVVVFEEDKPEFEEGDVLVDRRCPNDKYLIVRKMSTDGYVYAHHATWGFIDVAYPVLHLTLATPEEKLHIFDMMLRDGLKWDAEKKEVVKVLPRVKKGHRFFCLFFRNAGVCIGTITDTYDGKCNYLYQSGNYFITEAEAQGCADKFNRMLKGRT